MENVKDLKHIQDTNFLDDYKQNKDVLKDRYIKKPIGTVFVNAYTKTDGTDVSSYTRRAPSR